MTLKSQIINKIQENPRLKRALMDYFDKSQYTIQGYLKENNSCLTELSCLHLISAYLTIPVAELVTEPIDSNYERA